MPPLHLVPINDLIEHEDGLDCVCGPRVEWVDPDTGETYRSGPYVIHHSLDGRELSEPDRPGA